MRRRNKPVGKAAKTRSRRKVRRPTTAKIARPRKSSGVDTAKRIALLEHRLNEALEQQAASSEVLKVIFFTLLAASTVAALQTVGAFLVVAMVVTPGATAYLLTDRFERLILMSLVIGATTSFVGAYLSYFLDGATGGVIVVLQTAIFLSAFVFAPKHGLLASRAKARKALGEAQ